MKIVIEKSKTDIYREGTWGYISRSHNMCPVKHLEDYLRLVNITISSSQYIFRAISKGKKSWLRRKNKPISYTTNRQNLLKVIKAVGLIWKDYGLHSVRAGEASLAANKGIQERLFKRHGRWKSDRTKDGHVEDDLKMLLPVLKNLQNQAHSPLLLITRDKTTTPTTNCVSFVSCPDSIMQKINKVIFDWVLRIRK